ncbi:peptidylprolyl isomerase, partial [Pelagibacteraceae bacterium]|nr:peptidylprolyl isomerase [Pelagibacteraceae bacterium]
MFRLINNINYLFVFALIIGVLLVSQELFQSKSSNQYLRQQNAVALVNDMTISEDQFIKYISTLGIDVVDENDEELLEIVLEKMIEEELLLQKGIELELHKFDIQIRKAIIQQVIDSVLLQNEEEVTEKELREYYENNKNKYQLSKLIHLDIIFLNSQREEDINLLFEAISTIGFVETKKQFHQELFFSIPDRLISIKDCIQLLGTNICKDIFELNLNDISNPIKYENGSLVIRIRNTSRDIVDND